MPGLRRQRSQTEDDDNEDDSDSTRYTTPAEGAGSPKRPRLDSETEGEEESEVPASRPQANGGRANGHISNGVATDEFQPGAIVRVSVENFVTYEKADFFPGPNLNMVIGPNGTGKSSLVCAICLGLGYGPKHLGRAGSVKEFVKHGKEIATIEVELKRRPQDRRNYVIRVKIRREQNNQKWWLNGKETNHKNVRRLVESLKIQVDNLCQFLPQDRVVEFAASTPVDLLRETLRAAAPEEMIKWQSELRELHKDKKELVQASQTDQETLTNLENRQQGLQADVDRVREREQILERVTDLKNALIMAEYSEARKNYSEARDRRKTAADALKRLEENSGPSLEAVNQKQEYARQVKLAIEGREQVLNRRGAEAEKMVTNIDASSSEVKGFREQLDSYRTINDKKRREMQACKSKITSLQADLKNRPPDFNAAEWNQKIVCLHLLPHTRCSFTDQCYSAKSNTLSVS